MSRVDDSLDQSKIEAPMISSNSRDFLFVVLTCVAGNVYALSVFGLGCVFIGGPVFAFSMKARVVYSSCIPKTTVLLYIPTVIAWAI
ncbi:MAG: hypothetical protein WBZ36_06970 [Candidatus Nitrosopolaris sp.]